MDKGNENVDSSMNNKQDDARVQQWLIVIYASFEFRT